MTDGLSGEAGKVRQVFHYICCFACRRITVEAFDPLKGDSSHRGMRAW